MTSVDHALFGSVTQRQREHLEFQFKFLSILLVCGAALTGIFLAGSLLNFNKIDAQHVLSMEVFTASSLVLSFLLRDEKNGFCPLHGFMKRCAWPRGFRPSKAVTTDELRIFWLVTNVPGVFILLGKRAGWAITLLSVAAVLVANGHSTSPYSQNAVATYSLGMVYFAAFSTSMPHGQSRTSFECGTPTNNLRSWPPMTHSPESSMPGRTMKHVNG